MITSLIENVVSWQTCGRAHSEENFYLQIELRLQEFENPIPSTPLLDKWPPQKQRWRPQASVRLLEKEGTLEGALLSQTNRLSSGICLAGRKTACRLRGANI